MATITKERTTSKVRKSQRRNKEAKANKAAAAKQKAAPQRDPASLLYVYPDNIRTQEEKKTFRRQKRATFARLADKIEKLQNSKEHGSKTELKKVQLEFENFKKETYTDPENIVITE